MNTRKRNRMCTAMVLAIALAGCGEQQAESEKVLDADRAPDSVEDRLPSESSPSATNEAPAGPSDSRLGPALDAPENYYGVYASPERPARAWFIAEAKRPAYAERAPEVPPGHLMLGAMFGDVAPWQMKTVSETEFEQARLTPGQEEPTVIEFRLGADGRAEAFRFTGGMLAADTWLERTGDLPDGW